MSGAADAGSLLQVSGVTLRFGGVTALDDVSIAVEDGTVCALIGPNGAGKTTLFNCVSGLVRPDEGRVRFGGRAIERASAHRIVAHGVARTFQNIALIPSLSVLENVMLGACAQGHLGFWRTLVQVGRTRRRERQVRTTALEALDRLGLATVAGARPDELPFGSLKRVELARALVSRPKLLLLDEPACGLNHAEVEGLAQLILEIRRRHDLSVLVVEHNMGLVRAVADRSYVLDAGRVIAEGSVDEVSADPRVIEAYLGAPA
ncbi:ABC transporter ATP-binding protein [Patulibacter defluvii]|uniref:ABC transporter ATP-binding protein n=1 Tax=Patulibacter defluvii TaxID=3095358 RepID=UPI002A753870|nr:ABC transporter ATP-binding protein [Patulibacter sp. DM4]